ncbi:MAG: hypothetical protein ACLP1X_10785 [Polyangiaceae bacterium]|jgi:hypothetical protein
MSARFAPCPECARHVKQSDSTCPFCGSVVPHANDPSARVAVGRLSRSALLAASAVGATLATTECTSTITPIYGAYVVPDAAFQDASGDAADGGSSIPGDAAGEAGIAEGGSVQAAYGAAVPPTDGGGNGG